MQLSAVYTGLLTQRPEIGVKLQGKACDGNRMGEPSRPLSALALLNREKYLALLGDPGSGKSTSLISWLSAWRGRALATIRPTLPS